MVEQEIAAAIGWMMVASGALAVMLSSLFSRHGYRATTTGLLLALLGLLIAGHIWAAVVLFMLTFARYGYYLYHNRSSSLWGKNGASDAQSIGKREG
jgi:hypothetical protein